MKLNNQEKYYQEAILYFKNVVANSKYKQSTDVTITPYSIATVIHHHKIKSPFIQVKLEIEMEMENEILDGIYCYNSTENNIFISDELSLC